MTTEPERPRPRAPRMMRSPRRATIGAALVCLAAAGASSGASLAFGSPHTSHHRQAARQSAAGSGLGALSVSATSSALNVPLYSHTGEDVEASIPYSEVDLGTGGIGQGVSSVMWPGPTGAHGGDVLNLLGVTEIPASVEQQLNDPEVAEAQTGTGSPTVDNSHPGVTMKSSATPTVVTALAAAGGSGVPGIADAIGSTTAQSSITITGPKTVTVSSASAVHNITIANVIKIGAVTSIAHAVTDGHAATGTARTIVSGVTIAGHAVTIDNKGVHVPGKSLPIVGNVAATAVNTALKSAGVHIDITNTIRKIHGARATLSAGALQIQLGNAQYKKNANDTGRLLTIGGAQIDAQAHPGFPPPKPIKPPKTPITPGGTGTHAGGTAGTPGTPGTPGVPGTPTGSQGGATVAPPPVLAANPLALPTSLKIGWIILALAGAGLFAFGMKRLPDQVLQTAGPTCRLEE